MKGGGSPIKDLVQKNLFVMPFKSNMMLVSFFCILHDIVQSWFLSSWGPIYFSLIYQVIQREKNRDLSSVSSLNNRLPASYIKKTGATRLIELNVFSYVCFCWWKDPSSGWSSDVNIHGRSHHIYIMNSSMQFQVNSRRNIKHLNITVHYWVEDIYIMIFSPLNSKQVKSGCQPSV